MIITVNIQSLDFVPLYFGNTICLVSIWKKCGHWLFSVIERGRMDDFYAILNMYGLDGVVESIKDIPVLSAKDMSFVLVGETSYIPAYYKG